MKRPELCVGEGYRKDIFDTMEKLIHLWNHPRPDQKWWFSNEESLAKELAKKLKKYGVS